MKRFCTLFLSCLVASISLNAFCNTVEDVKKTVLQKINSLNKSCPMNVSADYLNDYLAEKFEVILEKVSLVNGDVSFKMRSNSIEQTLMKDECFKYGMKDAYLNSFIDIRYERLFREIEYCGYSSSFSITWGDKKETTYQYSAKELEKTLYSDDSREEIGELIKKMASACPVDESIIVNTLFNSNTQNSFKLILESVFLDARMVNWVSRVSVSNFVLRPDILKNEIIYEIITKDDDYDVLNDYENINESGYGIRHTYLLPGNSSQSCEVTNLELEDLLNQYHEMDEQDKLMVLYNYLFGNVSFPYKLDDNETLMKIVCDEECWIEYREVSSDIFNEIVSDYDFKEKLLIDLCSSSLLLCDFLTKIDCDYKCVLINKATKQKHEIYFESYDIDDKIEAIWGDPDE